MKFVDFLGFQLLMCSLECAWDYLSCVQTNLTAGVPLNHEKSQIIIYLPPKPHLNNFLKILGQRRRPAPSTTLYVLRLRAQQVLRLS